MEKLSQKERILKILQNADGEYVSTKYFKQDLLISECNGRLSELKNEGHNIETSKFRDDYGFKSHRLVTEPKQETLI